MVLKRYMIESKPEIVLFKEVIAYSQIINKTNLQQNKNYETKFWDL